MTRKFWKLLFSLYCKAMKGYQKRTWFITYGASCTSITHITCSELGVDIDECYTLTQRDFKYTLIHLAKKQTLSRIQQLLIDAEKAYGIKANNIFGYEPIAGDDLEDHPGMNLMIACMNNKDECFESWLLKLDLHSNTRGLMYRFLFDEDVTKMAKPQLEYALQKIIIKYNKLKKSEHLDQFQIEILDETSKPVPYSRPTHSILRHYRKNPDARNAMRNVSKIEKRLNKQASPDGSGEIYAAVTPTMADLHKKGFTFGSASTRVKALQTAGVLEPFVLVRHAHVPDARTYEKAMHEFFKDVRVHKRKEFFAVNTEDVNKFFDMVEGKECTEEDMEDWNAALAKAIKAKDKKKKKHTT